MKPSGGLRRWRRTRAVLTVVLLIVVLIAGGVSIRRYWARRSEDPARLGLLHGAWQEFNAERYDRATALLDRRAAAVNPTSLDWMLRAQIALAQGKPAAALDDLKRIPDSDSLAAPAALKTGQAELALHRARAAEAALKRCIVLDAKQIQAHRELAYLYAIQLRKADCDAQFRALAKLMDLGQVLAFAWCQSYCDIWDPKSPRPTLNGFVTEDPEDRPSRLALAWSYYFTHDFAMAESVLRPLLESDPDALEIRARSAIDLGEIPTAEKLVREGPADHAGLNALRGQLALHAHDPREAASRYRAALAQDPENRDALRGLGLALRTLGEGDADRYYRLAGLHDRLKRTIQDSVSTIRTDPKLFFKLGELCAALHRNTEARAWYRLAIERDPLDMEAQQALTRLNQPVK
jgi:predicted Zn-dependent protease